jgi:hypothetical protein
MYENKGECIEGYIVRSTTYCPNDKSVFVGHNNSIQTQIFNAADAIVALPLVLANVTLSLPDSKLLFIIVLIIDLAWVYFLAAVCEKVIKYICVFLVRKWQGMRIH